MTKHINKFNMFRLIALLSVTTVFAQGTESPSRQSKIPAIGSDWKVQDIGMEFVWIEALDCWVGKYEVTNGEYRKFKPNHDSKKVDRESLNDDRQPVVYVNYDDATDYALWLTAREKNAGRLPAGYSYRLPSKKEWTTFCQCCDNREYPWGNSWPPTYGNYSGQESILKGTLTGKISGYNDGFPVTCPVEESGKNEWGLYGVGGNACECTVKSDKDMSFNAWRGGSWFNYEPQVLTSEYCSEGASSRDKESGFRLLLYKPQKTEETKITIDPGKTLRLMDGKVYTNATVVNSDGISAMIEHEGGSCRIEYSQMIYSARQKYGYSPQKELQYYQREGLAKDPKKAIQCFRENADQGDASAQYTLGNCYISGKGVPQDKTEGAKWYRKAAEQGNADAQLGLGICYCNGDGVVTNYDEAVKWYNKAAEQGNRDAQYELGTIYENGNLGVIKNVPKAVEWYLKAAAQGDVKAQYNLGCCYQKGDGITPDTTTAVKWYRKAAAQGHADAQANLGVCYLTGDGVAKDEAEAFSWWSKAAAQGHAGAQFKIAMCYVDGIGVYKDQDAALEWLSLAAQNGHAESQYRLGLINENVIKNQDNALIWYKKAAAQGHQKAQEKLRALGYVSSIKTAQPQKGNPEAQYWLAATYLKDKDYTNALKWFCVAAEN